MTAADRFEWGLPELLSDLVAPPAPEHLNDTLARTARLRQRPAWTFPERWLPMTVSTARTATVPRIPWRLVGLLALLLLALAIGAGLVAGLPRPVPEPFGPAANGLLIFSSDGDIYTADPVSGSTGRIVSGPDRDLEPTWSRDGTKFVFERRPEGDSNGQLYVAHADGSSVTLITPKPQRHDDVAFSPTGEEVLFTSGGHISIAPADGSGSVRTLDLGMVAAEASFRPPDGRQIVFKNDLDAATEIYVVNVDGTGLRPLVGGAPETRYYGPVWSPDGSRLAFGQWDWSSNDCSTWVHVVRADGTGDRIVGRHPDAVCEGITGQAWSNDGSHIVIGRGFGPEGTSNAVVLPIDGGSPGIDIACPQAVTSGRCWGDWEWAPDDTALMGLVADADGQPLRQVLADAQTGVRTEVPWAAISPPSWQRRAP
jgi:hypothetical protein